MKGPKKLYVGNLSYDTTEHELLEAFRPHGARKSFLNIDKATGFSCGYGFVEFNDPEKCRIARDLMDGTELDNRTIRVNTAIEKPRNPRPRAKTD